jgi:hypothetical protein
MSNSSLLQSHESADAHRQPVASNPGKVCISHVLPLPSIASPSICTRPKDNHMDKGGAFGRQLSSARQGSLSRAMALQPQPPAARHVGECQLRTVAAHGRVRVESDPTLTCAVRSSCFERHKIDIAIDRSPAYALRPAPKRPGVQSS